jgi:hypothetical protein
MNIILRKWLMGLGILAIILVIAALGFVIYLVPARQPVPKPNGYDDFVAAGEAVSGQVGDFRVLEYDELENLISANAQSLRLVRVGLTRQCRAPIETGLTNGPALSGLAAIKGLALLLAAEGRLYEMDNRPGDAARSYLDAIRLGNEMSRGGMLITRLVGVACEAIGYQPLAKVVPALNREDDHILIAQLEQIDAHRVTWAEVKQGERECVRQHFREHLNPITLVAGWWNTRQAVAKAEARHKTAMAHERLLATELALRCYQCDKARAPTSLDDLVTNYLLKVPQDPFSAGPMVYHPKTATNWLVYSIGPDGVDDGGKPANRAWPVKGDILIDSAW